MQKSYVMIKPEFASYDAVIEEVKRRLENEGIEILEERFVKYDKASADKHYAEHVGKDFYPKLLEYITSDKAYGMIVEGENAIEKIRALAGSTKNPEKGTIRYDIPLALGIERRITQNVVHSSDSEESAKREIEIFSSLPDYQDENQNS